MNLLIHDLAAAIEREACDDAGSRDHYRHRGVTTYETRRAVPHLDASVPDQAAGESEGSRSR